MSQLVVTARGELIGTVSGMSYSSDLTDERWALLRPVFNALGKRDPSTRRTSCGWWTRCVSQRLPVAFLHESFGPWTRVWSQFRRWVAA